MTQTQTFSKNQVILHQGEKGTLAYRVLSGAVHVYLDKDGKTVSLATLGEGAIFGEMALLGETEYSANVESAADNTMLEVLTADTLKQKLSSSDPLIRHIVQTMARRLRETSKALLDSETREFMDIDFE